MESYLIFLALCNYFKEKDDENDINEIIINITTNSPFFANATDGFEISFNLCY